MGFDQLPKWAKDDVNNPNRLKASPSPSPSPTPEPSTWLWLQKAGDRLSDWWSGSPQKSSASDPATRDLENSIRQRRK